MSLQRGLAERPEGQEHGRAGARLSRGAGRRSHADTLGNYQGRRGSSALAGGVRRGGGGHCGIISTADCVAQIEGLFPTSGLSRRHIADGRRLAAALGDEKRNERKLVDEARVEAKATKLSDYGTAEPSSKSLPAIRAASTRGHPAVPISAPGDLQALLDRTRLCEIGHSRYSRARRDSSALRPNPRKRT